MTEQTKSSSSFSIRSFVAILFKRKGVILTTFSCAILGAIALSYFSPELYRVNAKLLVEIDPEKENAVQLNERASSRSQQYDWIQSELEIIKSFPVAAKVLEELNMGLLDGSAKNIEGPNPDLQEAVHKLRNSLKITNVKKSNIMEVEIVSQDPKQASLVVDKLIASYIYYRTKTSEQAETYSFFVEQLDVINSKLKQLERRQAEFKQDKAVLSPEAQKKILLTRLADYESKLTAVRTARITKAARLNAIRNQRKKGKDLAFPSTEASDSPSREKYIAKLRGDLLDLHSKRDQLLQKYTPQYEEVRELDNIIRSTEDRIADEIQEIIEIENTFLQAMVAEERNLEESIQKLKGSFRDFAEDEFEYNQLSRGIDDTREVYSKLLKEREEARISLAKLEQGVKIRVISPPVVPLDPVSPKKKLIFAIALILGSSIGIGLAFVMEFLDQTVETPSEFERLTGISALGSVREVDLKEIIKR